MIHAPAMIAARCVVPGLDCCDRPDHVTIECPTCRGEAPTRRDAECPRCENTSAVTACRHCGTVECAGTDPRDCTDWDGEDVAARVTTTRSLRELRPA